jgi:hypothetical protein
VVTSTLASLAGETWVRGVNGAASNRRFGAIAVIFLGAVTGAMLLKLHLAVPLGLAAAIVCVVVVAGHLRLHHKLRPIAELAETG